MRWLLIYICLISLHPRATACAGGPWGEDIRVALLDPYLIGKEYSAFFYSADRLNHYQNAARGYDRRRNARAWAYELGGSVTPDDVWQLLYATPFADYAAMLDSNLARPLLENPAWRAVRRRRDLLRYLLWAKAYEVPHRPDRYGWDSWAKRDTVADVAYYENFEERAQKGYRRARRGSFLKRRYAYQLLLLASYADDGATMNFYFDRHFAGRDDVLSDWARFHYAPYRSDPGKAWVDWARAFRVTPEKAIAVYQRTPDDFDPTAYLYAATDDTLRADLYVLAAVKMPGKALELIEQVHRYLPDHPLLPLLLVREINKLEDWLLTHPLTGQGPAVEIDPPIPTGDYVDYVAEKERLRRLNAGRDHAYVGEVRAFLEAYAASVRTEELTVLTTDLFRARLALLDDEPGVAARLLSPYDPSGVSDSLARRQLLVNRFVGNVRAGQLDRDELAADLQELKAYYPPVRLYWEKAGQSIHALERLAAQVLSAAGDTLEAYLLHNRSRPLMDVSGYHSPYYERIQYLDRDISAETMQAIIAAVARSGKGAFWNYVDAGEELHHALIDLAATQALRRGQTAVARDYLARLPQDYYRDTYAFGEYLRMPTTGIGVIGPQKEGRFVDKRVLLDSMLATESVATEGSPQALLKLGDYWYGMGQTGPAWMMLNYGWTHYPPYSDLHDYAPALAQQYWQQALLAADDPEVQAEAAFKLAMLDWRASRQELGYWADPEEYDDLYYDRFDAFVAGYHDTDFYDRVVQQCSWFRARGAG